MGWVVPINSAISISNEALHCRQWRKHVDNEVSILNYLLNAYALAAEFSTCEIKSSNDYLYCDGNDSDTSINWIYSRIDSVKQFQDKLTSAVTS